MARSQTVLLEWGNPLFLSASPEVRDLYSFLLYSAAPTSPLGLIWYGGDKAVSMAARKAGVHLVGRIGDLEKSGLAEHEPDIGLIYLPHSLNAGAVGLYSSRNMIAWANRVGKIPECEMKHRWERGLLAISTSCKKPLQEKISVLFGAGDKNETTASNAKAVEIVRYFSDKFSEFGYGEYVANWAREVSIAKELLVTLEAEDVFNRINLYFKDEWLSQNASMDFISFRRNINKFAKSAKNMPTKKDYDGYWDIINNVGDSK